ncbi:hypothetical protein [Oceaniglobus ichthyenteri]|uniref:hypothetical protein n=1 Tax=Oceaniglobus ichthyenteri TaxID=2136177 RepID=UPI000D347C23|nr:hypothetical protein [Oceaniglobus ichthyenteri]
MPFETEIAAILCALVLGGETEVSHPYNVGYDLHRIRVDCETSDQVVEVGLDKRSSLDSIQQALFAASLTGKTPVVAMIDTDGREGPFELRIRTAARMAGVTYTSYKIDALIRLQMTSYMRDRRLPGRGS